MAQQLYDISSGKTKLIAGWKEDNRTCFRQLCFNIFTSLFTWVMAKNIMNHQICARDHDWHGRGFAKNLQLTWVLSEWDGAGGLTEHGFRALTVPDVGDACYSDNCAFFFFFFYMWCKNTCFISAECSKKISLPKTQSLKCTHVHTQLCSFRRKHEHTRQCESVQKCAVREGRVSTPAIHKNHSV